MLDATLGTRVPTQDRAHKTRAALVRAGAAELSERGYAGATSRSIAARAGVATGSFYQYFRDKDALLREIAAERTGRIHELAVGSLDDAAAFAPSHVYGVEGRAPWFDELCRLEGTRTEDDIPADELPAYRSRQHPDHD